MTTIQVNDQMQKNYSYKLTYPMWQNFDIDFQPQLTPKQMLNLWVFGWKYLNDCKAEFPADWRENAKLAPDQKDPKLNFFKIDASMSLSHRQEKWWIYHEDPRWRFQWYCRYYMWRRCSDDQRQIKRRKAYKRHRSAVVQNCQPMDRDCRKKQRQSLLHWAYDNTKI